MSNIIPILQDPHPRPLPDYRARGLQVRLATMSDLPFLDSLQKMHSKQLGFFPRAQMEGYIRDQWILIAEQSVAGSPPHPRPLPEGEGGRRS